MGSLTIADQLGRSITLDGVPRRIVSLVPSQTELLAYLGLDDAVVGITKFCVEPPSWKVCKKVVGGTKKIRVDEVLALAPDLVLANKEENTESDIRALEERVPVWVSDVSTLHDASAMIKLVGKMTNTSLAAENLVEQIHREFLSVSGITKAKVLYLIWMDPWMGAASGTFIDAMLTTLGLENVLSEQIRYPVLSESLIRELNPELILLSSEPFPFTALHIDRILQWMPATQVRLVDGTYFSWYGSRLLKAPHYFSSIFTPSALRSDQKVG
ncbi:MAG TPA: helical backbone metal receptor [Cyclobacteriaceae bacterium]|nr:helical backbone metal receptor [Cyclobacteriaceae bacterium]